ncbi:MAG: CdaR family protein [Candidatus Marinimicrobia bacterium]|nr:CdaR family protein [Candidatus Neomarinimicrobiota bacterium]
MGAVNNDQRISLKSYYEQRPNQVFLQPEVTFLEIVYPDSIDIQVDKKITKEVPVKIMYDISVKPGYILVDKPAQAYISITGPEDYIESIDHVETETLKKENIDISFHEEITVINPKEQLINIEPRQIGVSFEVQMIGERTIHNIPIRIRNRPADLKVQFIPELISLRITGGNSEIQDLTKNDFSVYFDYLAQWFPNKNYYSVNINSPEEVLDIININPEKIEVVVIKNRE